MRAIGPIRVRRFHLRLGVISLCFFVSMLVASVIAGLLDAIPERRWIALIVFTLGWSFFITIALWLIAVYYRESVLVVDQGIVLNGVLTTRTIPFAAISRARWTSFGSRSRLKLFVSTGTASLDFSSYSSEQGKELIRRLRSELNTSRQEGWDKRLELYSESPTETETLREHWHWLLKFLAKTMPLGPFAGMCGGVYLGMQEEPPPAWSGSHPVDWTLRGLGVAIGLAVFIAAFHWTEEPEPAR